MSKKYDYKIPYIEGRVLSYPEGRDLQWRDNEPFIARVKFADYSRGRSSALLWWEDVERKIEYPMFMKDFSEAMPNVVYGELVGKFVFQKRGQNYGLKLLEVGW